ncbi:hypothetical protein ACIBHX_01800 [Nonomuraea sp. NPDC050536]|uniref:hypothetical protein n=1 Tax=Nonomuraea sp. NPDC050536 TaxID=3364366 RepID=UPI0037C9C2C7
MSFPPPPLADLTSAMYALCSAYREALLWADLVRQDTERRMGIGPTDERAYVDPAYVIALKWCSSLNELPESAENLLANAPKGES